MVYFGGDFRAELSLVLSSYVVKFIEWAIVIENKCKCSGFIDNGYDLIVDLSVGQKDWGEHHAKINDTKLDMAQEEFEFVDG